MSVFFFAGSYKRVLMLMVNTTMRWLTMGVWHRGGHPPSLRFGRWAVNSGIPGTPPSVSFCPATSLSSSGASSSSNLVVKPCVRALGEVDFTPCDNMFEGGLHKTKGTHWLFTQPLMKINRCWRDVVCSIDAQWLTWMPWFNGPQCWSNSSHCPTLLGSPWLCTTIFYHSGACALFHTGQLVVIQRPPLLC